MRRSFRGKRPTQDNQKKFKANEKIGASEVIVIDDKGQNLGTLSLSQALAEAEDRELDLVEVSPKANPPICKIMNYGSFKYQQEKLERKNKIKNKAGELKTIKISPRIGQHDIDFRVDKAIKFLTAGNKIKIELQMRGRENKHQDQARESVNKIITEIKNKLADKTIKIEEGVKKQGNKLSTIISI